MGGDQQQSGQSVTPYQASAFPEQQDPNPYTPGETDPFDRLLNDMYLQLKAREQADTSTTLGFSDYANYAEGDSFSF